MSSYYFSTLAGPTGPTGAASTVTGPTGAMSTVAGPTGAASTVTGPTGPTGSVGTSLSISSLSVSGVTTTGSLNVTGVTTSGSLNVTGIVTGGNVYGCVDGMQNWGAAGLLTLSGIPTNASQVTLSVVGSSSTSAGYPQLYVGTSGAAISGYYGAAQSGSTVNSVSNGTYIPLTASTSLVAGTLVSYEVTFSRGASSGGTLYWVLGGHSHQRDTNNVNCIQGYVAATPTYSFDRVYCTWSAGTMNAGVYRLQWVV